LLGGGTGLAPDGARKPDRAHGRAGVFLTIWSIAAGLLTDNVFKPWLISRGSDLPLILILFGVIGGAVAFGFLGLFLGPTLLAVGYELIRQWNAVENHEVQLSGTK
jgi:predicted PurR-regulated permease PerM